MHVLDHVLKDDALKRFGVLGSGLEGLGGLVAALAGCFRLVHGDIGLVEHVIDILCAVLCAAADRNADACRHPYVLPAEPKRFRQHRDDPRSDGIGGLLVDGLFEQDRELVTT